MSDEIKSVIDGIGSAFEEFKKANDQRLAKLEKGEGVAEISEKTDKLAKEIAGLEAVKQRLDRIEAEADKVKADGSSRANERREKQIEAFRAWAKDPQNPEKKAAMRADASPEYVKAVSNSANGEALPEEIDRMISDILVEVSPFRSLATVVNPSSTDYKKLVNVRGTASGWVAETTSRTETATSTFEEVTPTYGGLYAEPRATNWSIEDLFINVEAWIKGEVALEFAYQEGIAFITGNGSNKPTGLLAGSTAATSDYDSPARAFGTLEHIATGISGALPNDVLDSPAGDPAAMFYDLTGALKAGYRANAKFLMNRRTLAEVCKLRDGDGRPLWQPSLIAGVPSTLVGYQVVEIEAMPDIAANALPIAFGDFKAAYLIADYKGSWAITDPYTTKGYTKFYVEKRVGGKLIKDEAVKVIKCAVS